jgi:hypothetical protein
MRSRVNSRDLLLVQDKLIPTASLCWSRCLFDPQLGRIAPRDRGLVTKLQRTAMNWRAWQWAWSSGYAARRHF